MIRRLLVHSLFLAHTSAHAAAPGEPPAPASMPAERGDPAAKMPGKSHLDCKLTPIQDSLEFDNPRNDVLVTNTTRALLAKGKKIFWSATMMGPVPDSASLAGETVLTQVLLPRKSVKVGNLTGYGQCKAWTTP